MSRKLRAMMAASAAAVVVTLTGFPGGARAADVTWDGGGADDFTNTAANWSTNITPAAMDALIFDGAVRPTPVNNIAAGTTFRGITFAAGAAPFTLSGNAVTLYAQSGVVNNSPNLQTVTLPLVLGLGDHTLSGGAGGLALNAAITRNNGSAARFAGTVTSNTLANDSTGIIGNWATIASTHAAVSGGAIVPYSGYVEIGDTLSGPSPIPNTPGANVRWTQTTGTPIQTFTMANSLIDINTLTFANNTGLNLNFEPNTTLRFGASGGIFRASTVGGSGIVFGVFGEEGVGTVTAGGADNTPGELILNLNNGGISIRPKITDNGTGAVKVVVTNAGTTGAGELGFSSGAANSYTGGTSIASGILRGNYPSQFGTGPVGPSSFGTGAVHVAPGGHAYLDEFGTGNNTVRRNFANDFYLYGGDGVTPGIREGSLRLGRENVGVTGTIYLLGDSRIQFFGASGAGGQVLGRITGNASLKLGGGTSNTAVGVVHNTANDWTGNTTIDRGTIKLGNSEVIPNGAGKGNVTLIGTVSTTLDLNGFTETINGLSGGTNPLDPHKIVNNAAGAAHLIVGDNDANGTFGSLEEGIGTAVISGNTAVTKTGAGTQVFGGNNTYTGNTTMAGGVLSVVGSASVGAASNTLVFNGGTLRTLGAIAFARNATVNAGGGTFDANGFDSSVNNVTGAGRFSKAGAGKLTANQVKLTGALAVNGGALEIPTNGDAPGMVEASNLTIAANSQLRLNDNDLLLNHDGSVAENTIRQHVRDGRVPSSTSGIFSTPGPVTDDRVLAIADNGEWGKSTFNGVTIDGTTIVGKYTFFGDANLDGAVTGDDYLAVDAGLGIGTTWLKGDFNMDGAVTGDDYLAVDANLGKGTPDPLALAEMKAEMVALHASQFGEGYLTKLADVEANGFTTAVPEPGALSLIGFAAAGLFRRRRGHRHA